MEKGLSGRAPLRPACTFRSSVKRSTKRSATQGRKTEEVFAFWLQPEFPVVRLLFSTHFSPRTPELEGGRLKASSHRRTWKVFCCAFIELKGQITYVRRWEPYGDYIRTSTKCTAAAGRSQLSGWQANNQIVDGASGWQLRPFGRWTTIVRTEMEQGQTKKKTQNQKKPHTFAPRNCCFHMVSADLRCY